MSAKPGDPAFEADKRDLYPEETGVSPGSLAFIAETMEHEDELPDPLQHPPEGSGQMRSHVVSHGVFSSFATALGALDSRAESRLCMWVSEMRPASLGGRGDTVGATQWVRDVQYFSRAHGGDDPRYLGWQQIRLVHVDGEWQ